MSNCSAISFGVMPSRSAHDAQDLATCLAHLVVSGGPFEELPRPDLRGELECVLRPLDVAAGDVQGRIGAASRAFQDRHGIGGAGEAMRAADSFEEVFGVGFAGVVRNEKRDRVLVCELLERCHGVVVGLVTVGPVRGAGRASE